MAKMIAYCGLICSDCPAFLATKAFDKGDMDTVQQMVEKARASFGGPDVTVESLMCDGCLADSDRLCPYCAECAVRACAVERGMVNCAHCADYGCEKLEKFFEMAPSARYNLEKIRASL